MSAKSYLFYHFVITTKYRRPLLQNPRARAQVCRAASIVVQHCEGAMLAFNYGPDYAHIHMLIILPPTIPPAWFARDFKSCAARLANETLHRVGLPFWGRGYYVKTVGAGSLETARRYVVEQWGKEKK
jgi:REP element-mobilizing transposase RayT